MLAKENVLCWFASISLESTLCGRRSNWKGGLAMEIIVALTLLSTLVAIIKALSRKD